jgi:hypothetical protein
MRRGDWGTGGLGDYDNGTFAQSPSPPLSQSASYSDDRIVPEESC